MGTRVLEKLGLCMQYSWLLPHLSNRVAERLYKFMLSYGDYLCQLFLCQKQFFLMLLLCLKCPAYAYLLGSTFFLPSLPLALHLRHITSVLPLKIEDFFNAFLVMPYIKMFAAPLKSECTQSCKCRCVLPVCWGYRPVCREHGMLRHQAFILTAAVSAVLLVCMLQLGWNSNCVGSQAFWGELPVQPGSEHVPLCQPSEDCPYRASAF